MGCVGMDRKYSQTSQDEWKSEGWEIQLGFLPDVVDFPLSPHIDD